MRSSFISAGRAHQQRARACDARLKVRAQICALSPSPAMAIISSLNGGEARVGNAAGCGPRGPAGISRANAGVCARVRKAAQPSATTARRWRAQRPDVGGDAGSGHAASRPRCLREFLRIAGINIFDVLRRDIRVALVEGSAGIGRSAGYQPRPALEQFGVVAAASLERRSHRCDRWLSLPEGGMGAISDALAAAARSSGATIRTGAPSRASRWKVTRYPESSWRAENIRRRHRRFERRSCATLRSYWVRDIWKPKSRTAYGISARKAWPQSCIWRSTACPGSTGLSAEKRRRAARHRARPHYIEAAFDQAKYGQCSSRAGLEITIPGARQDLGSRR